MSECALQQLPHDALTLSKFCQWVVKFRYRQAYVGRNLYDSTVQCAYLSAVINITNVQICAKHLQSEYRAYFDKHLTHSMQDGSTMSHRSRISRLLSSASPTATVHVRRWLLRPQKGPRTPIDQWRQWNRPTKRLTTTTSSARVALGRVNLGLSVS